GNPRMQLAPSTRAALVAASIAGWLFGQETRAAARPLDSAVREKLAALAQQFWKGRPKTAFEEWDQNERAALKAAAGKIAIGEGQLADAGSVLWKPSLKLGPRPASTTNKRTIATPDGEAWFLVKNEGAKKGLVIGLHGGGAGVGSASEGLGLWTAKD